MQEKEDIDEFMKKVEMFYNMDIKQIKNDTRKLKIVIEEVKERTNASVEEIIKFLGISKTTFYKYLKL